MSPTLQVILYAIGFIIAILVLWAAFEKMGLERAYVKVVFVLFCAICFLFILCAPLLRPHSARMAWHPDASFIIPVVIFVIVSILAKQLQSGFVNKFNKGLCLCIDNAHIYKKAEAHYIDGSYLGRQISFCWKGRQQGDMRGYSWGISPPIVELQIKISPNSLSSQPDNASADLVEQSAQTERLKQEMNTLPNIQAIQIVDSVLEIDMIWYRNADLKDKSLIFNARADVLMHSIADDLARYPRLDPADLSKNVETVLSKVASTIPNAFV
jgi:hypothetical protein